MKKKVFTFLLTATLATSIIGAATVSASAALDEEGRYYPTTDETYRYYFYMPQDWENELSTDASIYWWGGSNLDGIHMGDDEILWPGVKAQKGDAENIFYVDCPQSVTAIIWNNSIDGGIDHDAPQYWLAKQTDNIGTEWYDPGESDIYPEGLENFNNMIYVLDPNKVSITLIHNKEAYNGEWYYYYGNGEYGIYPDKEDAIAANDVRNTEYYPPREYPTEPTTTPTEEPTTIPTTESNTGNQNGDTNKPSQPSTDPTSETKPAGSSTADSANGGSNNGAVQTGATSLAVVLLAVLSSVTGIVVLTRKKFD